MIITREIDGKTVEIELTANELMNAWNEAEEMMATQEADYRFDNELADDLEIDAALIKNDDYKALFKDAFLNAHADWEDNEAWTAYMPMSPYACMYDIARRYFAPIYRDVEKYMTEHGITNREAFIRTFVEKNRQTIDDRYWKDVTAGYGKVRDLLEAM